MKKRAVQRTLKRMAALLAALTLAFCGMALAAETENGADTHSASIDAVIVMDHSNSMSGDNVRTKNDEDYNRLDAAELFVGMCDMNGSRVAFIPFAASILTKYADKKLIDISDPEVRADKIEQIDELRTVATQGCTDLGESLSRAVRMLLERDDTTNTPMVLLLTDGFNMPDGKSKSVDEWDEETGCFQTVQYKDYSKLTADHLMEDAVAVAADNDIAIYSIALFNSDVASTSEDRDMQDRLERFAAVTGGQYQKIDKDNAADLPVIFGNMFANQIGSKMVPEINPVLIDEEEGIYEVTLPILNRSVLEANIYVPTATLQDVELYTPNGDAFNDNIEGVSRFESTNFQFFKIREPRVLGDWRLTFRLRDPEQSAADITFSLLYNYQITLKTGLGSAKDAIGDVGGSLTLGKGDALHIESRFYDSDGQPSADNSLYQLQTGEDWETIHCTWEMSHQTDAAISYAGELDNDAVAAAFTGAIDMSTVYTDAAGYNRLASGAYDLLIHASGAGLDRTNALTVTLVNSPPALRSASALDQLTRTLEVDDSQKPETSQIQTVDFDFGSLFVDPDNDRLTYALKPEGNAESILSMSIDADTGVAQAVTIRDEDSGLFRFGSVRYTLTVTDSDPSPFSESFPVTIKVRSIAYEISRTYENVTVFGGLSDIDGDGTADNADKNSAVTFSMYLRNLETNEADTTGEIESFTGEAVVRDATNTRHILATLPMTLSDTGTELSAVYKTPNTAGEFDVTLTYTYAGYSDESYTDSFSVINRPPEPVQEAFDAFPSELRFDDWWFPGPEQSDSTKALSLADFFTDPDNEAGLTYADPVFTDAQGNSAGGITFERDGDTVYLHPAAEGIVRMTLQATDGDGETGTGTREIRLTSIFLSRVHTAICIAAGIALFVALLVLILHLRKPRFPADAELKIMQGNGLYAYGAQYPLGHKRAGRRLADVLKGMPAPASPQITDCMKNVILKPSNSNDGSITVSVKQPKRRQSACIVTLTDTVDGPAAGAAPGMNVDLSESPWSVGNILRLAPRDGSNPLRICLTKNNPIGKYKNDDFTAPPAYLDDNPAVDNPSFMDDYLPEDMDDFTSGLDSPEKRY